MCISVPFYLRNNQNLKRIICYGLFDDYTVLGVVTSAVVTSAVVTSAVVTSAVVTSAVVTSAVVNSAVVTSVVVNHQSSQTNVLLLFSFLLTRIMIIVICPYFPVL